MSSVRLLCFGDTWFIIPAYSIYRERCSAIPPLRRPAMGGEDDNDELDAILVAATLVLIHHHNNLQAGTVVE